MHLQVTEELMQALCKLQMQFCRRDVQESGPGLQGQNRWTVKVQDILILSMNVKKRFFVFWFINAMNLATIGY